MAPVECLRLRIKDVEFDQRLLVVRDGKGEKDRVTCLPEVARASLQSQIATAKRLHAADQIYTHVLNRPGSAVKSPADTL